MFFPDCLKLIGYLASVIIWVSSKPCVKPSPRTKISFFLLSTCTEELLSTPKITFLPQLLFVHKDCERALNKIP